VKRLDNYQARNPKLFHEVIEIIKNEFTPVIEQNIISGKAQVRTQNSVFNDHEAVEMVLDVLSERGYHVTSHNVTEQVPTRIDLQTGAIYCETTVKFVFSVKFKRSIIRPETFKE